MTGLSSNYVPFDSSGLFTPEFFVNGGNCYNISFWHKFKTEQGHDGGRLEYSTDGGINWSGVGSTSDSNWYNTPVIPVLGSLSGWSGNSGNWIHAEHKISFGWSGSVVFRFRFGADAFTQDEGWAIDDFCFEQLATPCVTGMEEVLLQPFELSQNIPNPGHDFTTINYFIPQNGNTTFTVKNLLGQVIYNSVAEQQQGAHQIIMPLNNIADGVYYYSLRFNDSRITKKMVVIK